MSLSELLPGLRSLPRSDKLLAIQFLAAELSREEDRALIQGGEYPVWTPLEAHDAAATLLELLRRETVKP